jgi:hypothetical protein
MNDLNLISGNFFNLELPKEKQYLCKYFETEMGMQFLRYYYVFNSDVRFKEHTGLYCTKRWIKMLKCRYKSLIILYDKAKKDMDFTLLAEIQEGKYNKIYSETRWTDKYRRVAPQFCNIADK